MVRKSRESKHLKLGRKQIVFVLDGQTEKWYIDQMKRTHGFNVSFAPKLFDGNFNQLCEVVEAKCNDAAVERVVWIVDYDVIMKETNEAKSLPTICDIFDEERRKVMNVYKDKCVVIVNNPCLEFWYLLHYKSTTKYYAKFDALDPDLQKVMPGYEKTERYYDKGKGLYREILGNLPIALKNSENMAYDKEKVGVQGFSEMYKLFDIDFGGTKIKDLIKA